jgi:hypothetical protein
MRTAVFWVVALKFTDVLVMDAVSTSETSVNVYQTTLPYNPEDSSLHTRRCENLKSHKVR